jgi:hypothetical protein
LCLVFEVEVAVLCTRGRWPLRIFDGAGSVRSHFSRKGRARNGAPSVAFHFPPFGDARSLAPQHLACTLPGSEAFQLDVRVAALSEGRLDRALQPDFVVLVEFDEFEGLQRPGDRAQHFRCAEH